MFTCICLRRQTFLGLLATCSTSYILLIVSCPHAGGRSLHLSPLPCQPFWRFPVDITLARQYSVSDIWRHHTTPTIITFCVHTWNGMNKGQQSFFNGHRTSFRSTFRRQSRAFVGRTHRHDQRQQLLTTKKRMSRVHRNGTAIYHACSKRQDMYDALPTDVADCSTVVVVVVAHRAFAPVCHQQKGCGE